MSESADSHLFRYLSCAHCGWKIKVLLDCKFRFCPLCSRPRSGRIIRRLTWLIDHTPRVEGQRFKLLTLSMPNCSDLQQGIKDLVHNFRRLRQRAFWGKYVESGAFVIEITGRPNNWHPHIHAVLYARYIPIGRLRFIWRSISRGTGCDIRGVDGPQAAKYINKYISKSDVPDMFQRQMSTELSRFRLFQRFGAWHHLKIPRRLYDYPCPNCNASDWLSDFQIDYGHYRQITSFADIPPRSSLRSAGGGRPETSSVGRPDVGLQAGRSEPPPRFL